MVQGTSSRKSGKLHKVLSILLWIFTGLILILAVLPVVIAPLITAVPWWLAVLLMAVDGVLFLAGLRYLRGMLLKAAVSIGGFVMVAALAVGFSQWLAFTPPILGTDGRPLPGSIASLEQVELNGSRQWITVRGRDINRPVLLFLSGGPGGSELPSTRLHLAELEEHFVVVNWDQPGAGKSYGAVDINALTPERYQADGKALAEYLCRRFDEKKIYLMGESWGTILGIWLVRDNPDLFYAFISSGQMVNTTENDLLGYEFALRSLTEKGDLETVEALKRNGPPPYTEGNLTMTYAAYLGVLNDYMNEHAHGEGEDADILVDAIQQPEYGLLDKVNWVRGLIEVFNKVYPQLADLDFTTQANHLDVPVYFMVGRYDVNAMASLVERYYAVLEAPDKELIWFEKSGHPPLYSEAGKVIDVVVNLALARQEAGLTVPEPVATPLPSVTPSPTASSTPAGPTPVGKMGAMQEIMAFEPMTPVYLLNWNGATSRFEFVVGDPRKSPRGGSWRTYDPATGAVESMELPETQLSAAARRRLGICDPAEPECTDFVQESPGGKWVVYAHSDAFPSEGYGVEEVWLARTDGTQARVMKIPAGEVQWTPDEKFFLVTVGVEDGNLFFLRRTDDLSEIDFREAAGLEACFLIHERAAFSPDGKSLAFVGRPKGAGEEDCAVWKMELESREVMKLSDRIGAVQWTPDSSALYLLMDTNRGENPLALYRISAAGDSEVLWVDGLPFYGYSPDIWAVSDDGAVMVYAGAEDRKDNLTAVKIK